MDNFSSISFSQAAFEHKPYPHFCVISIFKDGLEHQLFNWLEQTADWSLTETEFYEQYEFSLLDVNLPDSLKFLVDISITKKIEAEFKKSFGANFLQVVGITAHKLTDGQRIGVHNDFINGDETHRLVIHLNPGWTDEKGGYLMLFNSSSSEDVSKVIKPLNNSGFGFEISRNSHHAISKIHDFTRYSLVYTFKEV